MIKRILAALFISVCFITNAVAWWQSVPQNAVSSGPAFSLTWSGAAGTSCTTGCSTTTTLTVTYGTVNLGATDANRVVAIAIGARVGTTATTIVSVTVGAQLFTQVSGAYQSAATSFVMSDVWYFADGGVLGTSNTITVVYSAAIARSAVYPYSIVTSTPIPNTATGASSLSSAAPSQSITVPAGGGSLAAIGSRNSASSGLSWTNASGDGANFLDGFSQIGSSHTTSTGSVTVTGTVNAATEVALSLVAWSP